GYKLSSSISLLEHGVFKSTGENYTDGLETSIDYSLSKDSEFLKYWSNRIYDRENFNINFIVKMMKRNQTKYSTIIDVSFVENNKSRLESIFRISLLSIPYDLNNMTFGLEIIYT
ncbi:hypothetical protein MXB_229, partial [Myxobolus squamalis]